MTSKRDWSKALEKAQRDLDRNRALINESGRVTAGQKAATWRRKRRIRSDA